MKKNIFERRLKELAKLPNVFAKDKGIVLAASDGMAFAVTTPPLRVQRACRGKFNYEISLAPLASVDEEHARRQTLWFASLNDFKQRLADAIIAETKKPFDCSAGSLVARSKAEVVVVDETSGLRLREENIACGATVSLELEAYYYDFRGSRGLRWRLLEIAFLENGNKRKHFECWQ
jgi:hypothetical protein